MAGWLGSSLASRLDNFKTQVSSMANEVFVEDQGEEEEVREVDILKELHNRCKVLEQINKEVMRDKEEQCTNFKQMLLEKEEEIMELQQMLDTEPELEDPGGGDSVEASYGNDKAELSTLRERNRKLQADCTRLKAEGTSLKEQLDHSRQTEAEQKTAMEELESMAGAERDRLVDQCAQLHTRLQAVEAETHATKLEADQRVERCAQLEERLAVAETVNAGLKAELAETQASLENQTSEAQRTVRERDAKMEEISRGYRDDIKVKEENWAEERDKFTKEQRRYEEEISEMVTRFELEKSKLSSVEESCKALESSLEEEMEVLKRTLEKREVEWNKEREDLAAQLEAASKTTRNSSEGSELINLQAKNREDEKTWRREKSELTEQVGTLAEEKKELTAQVGTLAEQVRSLAEEKKELTVQVGTQAEQVCSLEEEKKELKEQLGTLAEERKELKEQVGTLVETQRNSTVEIQTLNSEVKKLDKDLRNMEFLNAKLNEEKTNLELELKRSLNKVQNGTEMLCNGVQERTQKDLESSRMETEKFKTALKEQYEKLHSLGLEKSELQAKLADQQTDLEKLKELNSELRVRSTKLKNLEKENKKLKNQVLETENRFRRTEEETQPNPAEIQANQGPSTPNLEVKNGAQTEDLYDITQIVNENRELKERIHQIIYDSERSRQGERKLEAGELTILLKMKNVDLEQKCFSMQQENANLSLLNADLRSRSETSSVLSFPTSQDLKESSRELEKENLRSQVDTLKQRLELSEQSLEAAQVNHQSLETELEDTRTELQSVQENQRQALAAMENLEQVHQSTQLEQDKIIAGLEQKIQELEEVKKNLTEDLQRLEADRNDLEANIKSLDTRKKELEEYLQSLDIYHSETEAKLQDAIGDIEAKEAEVDSLRSNLSSGQQENSRLCEVIDQLRDKLAFSSDMESQLGELNERISFLQQELKLKDENALEAERTVQLLTSQFNSLRQETEAEASSLQQSLSEKEYDLAKSTEATRVFSQNIETLNLELEGFRAKAHEMSSTLALKTSELETLRDGHAEQYYYLQLEIDRLTGLLSSRAEENQTKNLDEELEALRRENTELTSLREMVSQQQVELSQRLTQLQQLDSELKTKYLNLEQLEAILTTKSSVIQDLEAELATKSTQLSELDSEVATKCSLIESTQERCHDLDQALSDLKGMNEMFLNAAREKEKELNAVKKSCVEITQSARALDGEVSRLKEEATLREGREKSLAEELQRYQGEVKQYQQNLEKSRSEEESQEYLVQVVNEKSRELTQCRTEISHLQQLLETERSRREELELDQSELRETFNDMRTESVKKLSNLVRDKELEIHSLTEKNKSLLEILQNEKNRSSIFKEDLVAESLGSPRLEAFMVKEDQVQRLEAGRVKEDQVQGAVFSAKDNAQHTNELLYLKGRISELEIKLQSINQTTEFHEKDSVESMEKKSAASNSDVENLKLKIRELEHQISALAETLRRSEVQATQLTQKLAGQETEMARLRALAEERSGEMSEKKTEYMTECERLRRDLKTAVEEREGLEARLRGRETEVKELHREVKSVIEKKKWVEGEVERLRAHLVQVEESYTQELVQGEDREQELRRRVGHLEDKVKKASLHHSEASQEASEATSHLTEALTAAASSRDRLTDELKASQTKLREKSSALRNLQLALEGLQRQRENELRLVDRQWRDKVEQEQRKQLEIQDQLTATKLQLERAGEGLEAASRLSQQLDLKQQQIAGMKHEVSTREELLQTAQLKLKEATSAQVGRVDRELVKNIVLGYVIADSSKKPDILKVIATVLDFNKEDRERTGLDGDGSGWFGGFLRARRESGAQRSPEQINQSIAQAFVKFLEEESVPQAQVVLPVVEMARSKQEQLATNHRTSPSPLLLNPLPTLSPTSSILKKVLDAPEPK